MLGHRTGQGHAPLARLASSRAYAVAVLWIGVYLIWGSLLTQWLWSRGLHATTDQWAYHALMEQLGNPNHHGYVEDQAVSAPDGAAPGPRVAGPDLVAAQATALAGPADGGSLLAASVAALCLGLLVSGRLPGRRQQLLARLREPPESPPPNTVSISPHRLLFRYVMERGVICAGIAPVLAGVPASRR